jgi:ribosomal protein S21
MSRRAHIAVTVKDDFDRKYRQFKKKIEREGIMRDAKRMIYFESKSLKNRKKFMRAVKVESIRRSLLNEC